MNLFRPLVAMAALGAITACSLSQPPGSQALPSSAQSGIPVLATPIRLVIPEGLATGATAETIDVVTDQTGASWDVAPAHLQLTFQGYALPASYHVPQLFVYPSDQYTGLNPSAAESRRRLQAVLADPFAQYDNDALPHVPFFTAAQVFAAQQKVLRFSSGAGVRLVTQYSQDVSPINNSGLFYHFEGLTDDARYYIIAVLPVNLSFLPIDNDSDSPVPAGGVPFPASSSPGSSFEDYFKRTSDLINAASPEQFHPSITTLDALIESISAP